MQGKLTPIRLPASLDATETSNMNIWTLQPIETTDLASFSAVDFVRYIIDNLNPYYYNHDNVDDSTQSKTPEIDLNNLMIAADLRSFAFGPQELMAAVKATPAIATLVGLPLTFFYSPDGSQSMLAQKPWFYLQVNAEQMTQLTGTPTTTFASVDLYFDTHVAVRGSSAQNTRAILSDEEHLTCAALGFPGGLEELEAFILNPIAADGDDAPNIEAFAEKSRRFSRLPADYPPGTELAADDHVRTPTTLTTANTAPRDHSESSGSNSDLTARSDSPPDVLAPFLRSRRAHFDTDSAHRRTRVQDACCTIS